jgi:rare lipoprotein A
MRQALIVISCLTLLLCSCGEKRSVRAAVPPAVNGIEVGIASWYGHPYHGRTSASGEVYDMEQLTAAHRTLPFGTLVRVVNLENEKTVDVRINDRGPFIDERIIDLSHAAAQAIDLIGPGIARVRLEVLLTPAAVTSSSSLHTGVFSVQVGAFRVRANADRVRAEMEARYGAARLVLQTGTTDIWRVLVGHEASINDAGTLAKRIRSEQELAHAFVVREDVTQQTATSTSF